MYCGKQGSTGVVWGLIPALATVASLVCTATGSVFYKFDVVASVGQPIGPNLTSIGEFPSINDRGDVAFMGEDANGFLNYIFVGNGITSATNITPSFGLTATADFSNAVQINNAEQVISQDSNSSNGTFLDNLRLEPKHEHKLTCGTSLRFGDITTTFLSHKGLSSLCSLVSIQ